MPSALLEFGSFQDLSRDERVSDPDPYVFMAHGHRRVTGDLLLWVGRLTQSLSGASWRGFDVDQSSFGVGGASGFRVNVIH